MLKLMLKKKKSTKNEDNYGIVYKRKYFISGLQSNYITCSSQIFKIRILSIPFRQFPDKTKKKV